jgi:hypothetical protein
MVNLLFWLIVGVQCRQFQVYPVHAASSTVGGCNTFNSIDCFQNARCFYRQQNGCPGTCTEAQEGLSHFPQKTAFWANESVVWRFEVPGRIVTKSTTQGWPEMVNLLFWIKLRVESNQLNHRETTRVPPFLFKQPLLPWEAVIHSTP